MSQRKRGKRQAEGNKPVFRAAIATLAVASGAAFYDVLHTVHARLTPDLDVQEHIVVTPSMYR